MKFVNENIDDILKPKNIDDIKKELKELSFDQKFILIEELWYENWKEFVLDISRYMGDWKFENMVEELIILKQQEQI